MVPQIRVTCLFFFIFMLYACGPDTIFLRPTLDTPEQHVKNGNSLLAQGKIDAAEAEFLRAKELDAGCVPAYVGLALADGHRGDFDDGFETLERADALVSSPEERAFVEQGVEALKKMRQQGG
jgi:hypothetical protein